MQHSTGCFQAVAEFFAELLTQNCFGGVQVLVVVAIVVEDALFCQIISRRLCASNVRI